MQSRFHRLLLPALLATLLLCLTACSGVQDPPAPQSTLQFQMGDDGYLTWQPVPGAVQYECNLVNAAYVCMEEFYLDSPGYSLPQGYSLHVRPIFADGSIGDWAMSDYYGASAIDPSNLVSFDYDITHDQLECFELLGAIRWDTLQTDAAGLLRFEADGPHGTMRFEAQGVTAQGNQLLFQPGARIWGLDAIGRICMVRPTVADAGSSVNEIAFSGGYTFSQVTAVDSHEQLMYVWPLSLPAATCLDPNYPGTNLLNFQPNFIIFGSSQISADAFTLSALEVYYDTATFTTGIRHIGLNDEFYGTYLAGERYDPSREVYDQEQETLTFYLMVIPDVKGELTPFSPGTVRENMPRSIIALTPSQFTTGTLRDAQGNPLERTAPLQEGTTLDVTVGDHTYPVALPVNPVFTGAQTMHDLVPYGYAPATGEMNALLIPVTWQDQSAAATADHLLTLKAEAGRVLENGAEVDYSDQLSGRFSLSRYFDVASYGQLHISTFVTDWFVAPFDYSTYETMDIGDKAFRSAAYTWLMETYPDMDWTAYDRDANGYFDAVIFVNVGTSAQGGYTPWAFSGGAYHMPSYNGGAAGTPERPTLNGYINVNAALLPHNTLVHEFGHNLGLIDYYDVTYTGIDAVGKYDMQSGNVGDWNPYSKYAAGWITPTVVDLQSGESAEYTIGTASDSGDTLLIPVHSDSFDGPFNEYILVDLFTPGGVNTYDASQFGLENTTGVRIYHVDARMETHVEQANGVDYPLGTPASVNSYNPGGRYQVELIQAGGVNTFTDLTALRPDLRSADLFYAGMSFSLQSHGAFFQNGAMNDGSPFPYTVEVVRIQDGQAVIRISAQ